ncbi:MAG: hypothetical protein KGM43_07265 [Planctomycetota bacterium]|nr:hypothetical protein [Planctomycetota bacterium]
MSGPIVRKYGFPNFEKIFGEREPQHGVEDEAVVPAVADEAPAAATKKAEVPTPKKKGGSKRK